MLEQKNQRIMKHPIIYRLLIISVIFISFDSYAQQATDLFILLGQSNALGEKSDSVDYPNDPDTLDPHIKLHYSIDKCGDIQGSDNPYDTNDIGGWQSIELQSHGCYYPNYKKFGPEITFARELKEAGYNPAIFKFVRPGDGIYNYWESPGDSAGYDNMKEILLNAIDSLSGAVNVRGVVWIQGEGDSDETDSIANLYESSLKEIIDDLRNTFESPTLPFVLGVNEIFDGAYIDTIVEAQKNIALNDKHIIYSSTLGLDPAGTDSNHFSSDGIIEHGERIYLSFDSIIESPAQSANWELISAGSDEFNQTTGLDTTKWISGVKKGRHEEWFDSENISVTGGNLILSAKFDSLYTINNSGDSIWKYFSASEISTKGTGGNFKYGYFEARIKIPYNTDTQDGEGFFPSFWLSVKNENLGNKTWPPEIDVFEYSGHGDYAAHGTNQLIDCDEDGSIQDRGFVDSTIYQPYNNFYIYGLEWNEKEIKWYIDDCQVGSTKTFGVPHDFLRTVLSLQLKHIPTPIASSSLGDLSSDSSKMFIDWVRMYKPIGTPTEGDYDKWDRIWDNANTDTLGEWTLSDNDLFVVGNFDNDTNGLDEVLSMSYNNIYAKMHRYDATDGDWDKEWGNGGDSAIGPWNLNEGSFYISGNFDGSGVDELLCINDPYLKLLNYNSTWSTTYGNNGDGTIDSLWNIDSDDTFLRYDFDNDGSDELICFSHNSEYCKVLSYDSGSNTWSTLYGNNGDSAITPTNNSYWNMSSSDTYIVGDFNGNGKGDLLMINEGSGYSKMFEFKTKRGGGYTWLYLWGNGGDETLNSDWNLSSGSKYHAYDMGGSDGRTELFCISDDNKYEKILNFNTTWSANWGNAGSYQIYNRDLVDSDQFLFGHYTVDTIPELLWIKSSWINIGADSSCQTTHVYLHEMPNSDFTARLAYHIEDVDDIDEPIAVSSGSDYIIYPNPSKNYITIESNVNNEFYVTAYNIKGQIIVEKNKAINKYILNISNQPKGLYFIKIVSEKDVFIKRVIRN